MNLITQFAPNQIIIETQDSIYLQSYTSIVGRYDKQLDYIHLGKDWDYSATTLKYIKRFISKLCHPHSKFKITKKDIEKALKSESFFFSKEIILDNPQAHYDKA
jgi:hypothetical protein